MRKIIASAFVSLDGVMQAPGGPEEDPSGGFAFGGWVAGIEWDETMNAAMNEILFRPYDLLLGRKTYDIFAAYWPYQDDEIGRAFNTTTKYVATHRPEALSWAKSKSLGKDAIAALRTLKKEDGPDLLTQGSSDLLHQLFAADLIDELTVLTFPIVLGKGKKLFDETANPGGLKLISSAVSKTGVVIAKYQRAGEVRTGSFAADNPSVAELERRKNWR